MAGYGFLGLTYGIYMHELGFNFLYPMVLALTVYAGSVEFLLGNMLLGSFHPLQAFLMALVVNARHQNLTTHISPSTYQNLIIRIFPSAQR